MKKLFFGVFIICCLFSFPKFVEAVSACPEKVTVEQPNGEKFKAYQRGDEGLNYVITEEGKVVSRGKDGFWYYNQMKVSKDNKSHSTISTNKVGIDRSPPTATKEELFMQTAKRNELTLDNKKQQAFNTQNLQPKEHNILVLLVEFEDVKLTYSSQDWQTLVFGDNEGTLKDYYLKNTKGRVKVKPANESSESFNDGIIRVKLDGKHPNTQGQISYKNQKMTRQALEKADKYINYKEYDVNRNGRIEADEIHFMVIVAGKEESAANVMGEPSVWGHRWALNSYEVNLDNTMLDYYTQFGEKHGSIQATLGIIAHEFGHDLGLSDLYNVGMTDENGKKTKIGSGVGYTSVMGSGSWGAKNGESPGKTPTGLDAYSKVFLGMDVQTITESSSKTIQTIDEGEPTILRINSNKKNEFFLLENRQMIGYDLGMQRGKAINSGGIAVYLINKQYDKNYTTGKQLVTVLEADEGIRGESYYGIGGNFGADPFYYKGIGIHNKSQQTKLSRDTSPSTKLSDQSKENFSILINSEPNTKMNINILHG
ncbi:M6 family metalloprotease domain-containing protein, partial [Enterococcus gilvus]|uniref:M6 family metalloprotease domain-containing protein n=1 Tax=Enterococcus gilvus TaxID=160453 RepID=UPI003D6B1674